MRVALAALIGFALVVTASGQRGGHGGGGGGVSHGGGGGFSHGGSAGGFSRGFSGGAIHSGGIARGGFSTGAMRGGFNRGGTVFRGPNRGHVFVRNGFRRFGNGFRYYGWPYYGYYGYPYYYNPYPYFWDDSSYDSGYPASADQVSSYYYNTPWEPAAPEPVEQPPVVVYQAPPPQQPAYQAPANSTPEYLIAFNDHNIKIAVAYWTEKSNLKYVTTDHEIKTAPLSSVDRDLSMRLNQERRVTFSLPASGA